MATTAPLRVLHEDLHVLAVEKPAGLLTAQGRWDAREATVFTELARTCGLDGLRLVHRLDRETSGLLVIARTADAQRSLCGQWERRTVLKEYLALVRGAPERDSFVIDAPLRTGSDRKRVSARGGADSKNAVTECDVVERFRGYALVCARPRTGRRHQIRAHLASIGLPIVADRVYGDGLPLLLSELNPRYKRTGRETPLLARTGLHAARLEFDHPATGARMRFESDPPKDIALALKNLRKFAGTGTGTIPDRSAVR